MSNVGDHAASPNAKIVRHALYASGNFAKSSLGSFVELFALFFLTDILKIPAAIAGMVLFVSLVWDGMIDPLMGLVADRLRHQFPTVRLYFLVGAPLTAIAFIALFHAYLIPQNYNIIYVFLALILFRSAYTIVDIPHNSLLSFLSRDSRDRTNIASLRIFFSAAGRLVVTLGATAMFEKTALGDLEQSFSTAAISFAAIYLVGLGVCLASIWNVHIYQGGGERQSIRIASLFRGIMSNSQLLIVFMLTAVTSLTTPVIGNAIIYYGKYGLGVEQTGATALVVMSAAQAFSLLFWSNFSNRLRRKKTASLCANLLLAVAMALAILILNSTQTLYLIAALAGFAIGGIFMLNWSMLPDALDYGQALSSYHYNMSVFGLYTLTNKGFIGLSQVIVGSTLAAYGYQADSPAVSQSIGAIVATLLAFPLLGALTCALLLRGHTQVQNHRQ